MNLLPTRLAPAHLGCIFLATLALALFGSSAIPIYAADSLVRTVALTGQPAAGTAPSATYDAFTIPIAFNDLGQVAFQARLQHTSLITDDNDVGIWSEGRGPLALVARENDFAPGFIEEIRFGASLSTPALNNRGQTGFFASLSGPDLTSSNDASLWSELDGPLALAAREGDQAPGLPVGSLFSMLGTVRISDEHLAFTARTQPNLNDSGIWRSDGSNLESVALEGALAPDGGVFSDFDGVTPALGAGGHIAFRARLRLGGGVTGTNDAGIWADAGGLGLSRVARGGSQAPGTPAGVNFDEFDPNSPAVNASGRVAFQGTLHAVISASDTGVWSEGSGTLDLVAREGNPAPGVPSGHFGQLAFSAPTINAAGDTAFLGRLQRGGDITLDNDEALWAERGDMLQLIARKGDQAPGAPAGATFDFRPRQPPTIVLNDEGRLAFSASLRTSVAGVTSANDFGIWAEDLAGVMRLIVREGDVLEVAPGDFRTIAGLFFRGDTGRDSDQGAGFNNAGEVAFVARFTDNTSGVFVSRLAAIPEPSSLALGMIIACCGGLPRRRC